MNNILQFFKWSDNRGIILSSKYGNLLDELRNTKINNRNDAAIDHILKSQLYRDVIKEMPIFEDYLRQESDIHVEQDATIGFSHVLVPNTLPLLVSVLKLGLETHIITKNRISHDPHTMKLLQGAQLVLDPVDQKYTYAIDCNSYFSKNPPLKGAVEVTRSGIIQYNQLFSQDPGVTKLVDVDNTKSKLLETFIGNPKAVMRTLEHFKGDLIDFFDQLEFNKIAIIGFGKIGRGLAREIKMRDLAEVLVCDKSANALELARNLGFETYQVRDDKGTNSLQLSDVSIIFTATGYSDTMSIYFEKPLLTKALKINVGALDEWGKDYLEEEIFHSKFKPFNFNLTPPTDNKYIDPILFVHFMGLIEIINQYDKLNYGYNKLSSEIDEAIVEKFDKLYNNESKLLDKYFS